MFTHWKPFSGRKVAALRAAGYRAAPFEEHDVAPAAVQLAETLAATDHPESMLRVQRQTGLVLRKDPGLQRPHPALLGLFDQPREQQRADALSGGFRRNVHADLRDATVHA